MGFSPIPRLRCERYDTIKLERLQEQGITLLLLDLDNTITPYGVGEPSDKLKLWVEKLREEGIEPFILSNSRKAVRVPNFAADLGVPYIKYAGKPKKKGFLAAMAQMGKAPQETAIVGDQIFTDILGGNRSGILTILVRPLRMDTIFRQIRYGLETPFRMLAKQVDF